MTHVPFSGGSAALVAVLGGHVDVGLTSVATSLSNIEAGKITALAIGTDERFELLPNVPTFKELGYPNIRIAGFNAFAIPKGIPEEVKSILISAIEESINDESIKKVLVKGGSFPSYLDHTEWVKVLEENRQMWEKVAIQIGLIE